MDEKYFRTVKSSGVLNIVAGVVSLVTGITLGVLLVVTGARLLASKSRHLF